MAAMALVWAAAATVMVAVEPDAPRFYPGVAAGVSVGIVISLWVLS